MSKSVTGWFLYNPLRQKPISLEPLLPWGAFYYYGPDPAAGCSYGSYKDSQGNSIVTESAHIVYSPITGEPMEHVGNIEHDYVVKQLNSSTADIHCNGCCEHCEVKLVSNFKPSYCYSCGEKITEVTSYLNKKEKKTMNLKERVLAKLEQKKSEEKNLAKASIREKVRAKIKAKIEARRVEAADEEWVDLDTVINEATSGEDDSAVEKAIEEKVGEAAEKVADKMEEKVEKEVSEVADEAAKEDEFMPLDMVLSMVERRIERKKLLAQAETEKKDKISKIKAKVKARLQAKADADKDADDQAVVVVVEKEEVGEKVEVDLAAPAHEKKMAVDPLEKIVPSDVEKVPEAPAELIITEAVKFEPLASVEKLAKASREDIELTLYGNETENPFWNVTAFGTPVAKIELGKQVSPEEIRNVFCSDDYALDLIEHCATSGLVDTLKKVNADFWANSTASERLEKHYNTIVDKKVSEAKAKLVASFKDDFIGSLRVVTAGMNKNLYPDLGNSLKDSLYTSLVTLGLPESTAKSAIEKSFAEGSAQYFDTIFTKATEYMNLSREARQEIAAAVAGSATIDQSVNYNEPATLSNRLVQASIAPQIAQSGFAVENTLKMDSNDYKSQLKSVWRK